MLCLACQALVQPQRTRSSIEHLVAYLLGYAGFVLCLLHRFNALLLYLVGVS